MESLPIDHLTARVEPATSLGNRAVATARPRVLQIVHTRETGGVQTLADSLATGLAARGFTVETEYLYPEAGGSAVAKVAALARMMFRLQRGGYDALIAYQPTAAILIGLGGRLAGCPLRLVHQTTLPSELSPLQRGLDKLAGSLGLYTLNVANTAETLDRFSRYPEPYRRSMMLIEHGVACPCPRLGRRETLRHFGVPDDGPILLNVGRLSAQKNQNLLIRALPALANARLVIAGGGPRLDEYRELATSLGVDGRLHLLRDVDSNGIANLYGAADLFVFPSTWESFGLAAVEAAMAGLPIVASDLAVLREVLRQAGSQVAFAPGDDLEAWQASIQATLTRLATAQRAPLAVRKAIEARYGLDRMLDDYARLLTRALGHDPEKWEPVFRKDHAPTKS